MFVMAERKQTIKKPDDPQPAKTSKRRGPVLFISLDANTEASLVAFISSQVVEPDRSAVGLKALREFLAKQGYWPPPKPKS